MTPRQSVLDEASKIIHAERNKMYGSPYENHKAIAALFNAATGMELTAREAAVFMICVKLSRMATSPEHRDHYVDLIGYAAIAWECTKLEEEQCQN